MGWAGIEWLVEAGRSGDIGLELGKNKETGRTGDHR